LLATKKYETFTFKNNLTIFFFKQNINSIPILSVLLSLLIELEREREKERKTDKKTVRETDRE